MNNEMLNTPMVSLAILLVCVVQAAHDDPLESQDIIEAVNNARTTWKAGRNFPLSATKAHLKNLLGVKENSNISRLKTKNEDYNTSAIPENFDARKKWSFCKALQEIADQGSCASCWAVSAASAFTDRLCIATNGSFNGHLSVENVLACKQGGGCNEDDPASAWEYFYTTGIVTGGDYNSSEGCQPYSIPPCIHTTADFNCSLIETPRCINDSCYNKDYKIPYNKDIHKSKNSYTLDTVAEIQNDIFNYGPVTAVFEVFTDFTCYKAGVYQYTYGPSLNFLHAVKVIGWGVDNNTDYWLAANTWNTYWGEMKGFFKFKRGTNECDIESNVWGGHVDV